jgi:hypothetical protein
MTVNVTEVVPMSITSTGLSGHELGTTQSSTYEPGTALEVTRRVAQRCGVSVRTVKRWVAVGILDPPIQVNGRDYFPAGVMPRRDPGPARKPPAAGQNYRRT